jgi:predicted metal-dependent HD superfamily phosphohydrolase
MGDPDTVQVSTLVDGENPSAVIAEAERIFKFWYDDAGWEPVARSAEAIVDLFEGRFPGYRACDTDYHDIRHTMAVLLATARIADGLFIERGPYPVDLARDLLVAAVCHDTGYIRTLDEEGGTGARFTAVHVARSAAFAEANIERFGLGDDSAARVARLVFATGTKGEYGEQAWAGFDERQAGAVIASADLVGQMSDRAYLEKLLFLYYEFKEAGFPGYETEFDMLRKTMGFYDMTVTLLDDKYGGIRSCARRHFAERWGIDRDLYAESMDRQMAYLQGILDDATTNFRKKLKRIDLELSQPRTA